MCVGMCSSVQVPRETFVSAPLQLELEVVVIILIWVLGSKPDPREGYTL